MNSCLNAIEPKKSKKKISSPWVPFEGQGNVKALLFSVVVEIHKAQSGKYFLSCHSLEWNYGEANPIWTCFSTGWIPLSPIIMVKTGNWSTLLPQRLGNYSKKFSLVQRTMQKINWMISTEVLRYSSMTWDAGFFGEKQKIDNWIKAQAIS